MLQMTCPSDLVDGFRYAGTLCREIPRTRPAISRSSGEQVTFKINLKTTKAFGMTVPPSRKASSFTDTAFFLRQAVAAGAVLLWRRMRGHH
jgi:hypothetical protein